ncbi:MAG: 6-phosphogluconolactonase [Deinococcota bacterium]
MDTNGTVKYVKDVARAATDLFIHQAEHAIQERGEFHVILSGGSTPLAMYKLLVQEAANAIFWQHTNIFWGDERFVPHDHADSNYGAAKQALLDHVPIPPNHVHPMPYLQDDPKAAVQGYHLTLTQVLGNTPMADLTFLGLGDDAHTASLFPQTGAVHAGGLVTVVETEAKGTRLSLTASTLSHSRTVAFLVAGDNKRDALNNTLNAPKNIDTYPAQAIKARESLLWLTDIEFDAN